MTATELILLGDAEWIAENARRLDTAMTRLAAVVESRLAGGNAHARFDGSIATPLAVEQIALRFGLTPFERDLLLLGGLLPRNPTIADSIERWRHRRPLDFALAADLLSGAERFSLSPVAPLRRWRLLEPAPGVPPDVAALSIDERVLFYMEGHNVLDSRFAGLIRPTRARSSSAIADIASDIGRAMERAAAPAECAVVELTGGRASERAGTFVAACRLMGLRPYVLSARDIPASSAEREALARLWEREAMLLDAALLIDASELPLGGSAHLAGLLQDLEAITFVSSVERLAPLDRTVLTCPLPGHEGSVATERWRKALGPLASRLNGSVERTAYQFALDDESLASVAAETSLAPDDETARDTLWNSARRHARRGLELLAERIDSQARWEDLVLPAAQTETLQTIAVHVRERHKVYGEWGFAEKSTRGLGLIALFHGGSGTGKTLAAEVLARELQLDLYRIDLARLVSKYIGETEKNLARVFAAAESGGAILLFDEADALFGKRSEVRDSHDRYANLEVSYLLQRIETYRGLSVLTTNLKQAIDSAFLRRLRFVVSFPFPDDTARQHIWTRVFPQSLPREGLDFAKLARLNLPGGHIRNIALNAAFLAANENGCLRMSHLRSAAEAEYAKLERPLPRADIGDWG